MIKTKHSIFKDEISYISNIDMTEANLSKEKRLHFIQLATISRNKLESKNPPKLLLRLLKETNDNKPSRPVEFIPVKLYIDFWNDKILLKDTMNGNVIKMIETLKDKIHFYNELISFSYIQQFEEYNMLHTNMRALLNYGIEYDKIPFNKDCSDFKCITGKIPRFVYDHLVTHTQLSTESSSVRIQRRIDTEYWYPENIDIKNKLIEQDKINHENILYLKEQYNYPFELGMRDMSSRRYISFVMTGWYNNIKTWINLFSERSDKTWTQNETKIVVNKIKEILS